MPLSLLVAGLLSVADAPPTWDAWLESTHTIALDAARLLGDARERARVRICASDTCSARFYDRSRAARRRCAPPSSSSRAAVTPSVWSMATIMQPSPSHLATRTPRSEATSRTTARNRDRT